MGNPITYLVSIDSEDMYEGQWNDNLVIVARDGDEARSLAIEWVEEYRETRSIDMVMSHPWDGSSAVIAVRFLPEIT